MNKERKKIAVLYGGISSEREISLISGKNVYKALIDLGYYADLVDVKDKKNLLKLIKISYDFAFICLHGKGGEDGSIQGYLTTLGIPYSGPGIFASASAINKAITKKIYDNANINTAPYYVLRKDSEFSIEEIMNKLNYHVVIKAVEEGSSIGLYNADNIKDAEMSILKAFEYGDEVLVEKYIRGKEFTVSVIEGNGFDIKKNKNKTLYTNGVLALPVIEIIPKNSFYDFESKYDEDGSKHVCPARINKDTQIKMQNFAIKAFKFLHCKGYCRTDFIVDNDENIYALETNTIPGMTEKSLFPDAAKAVGISFKNLCQTIIEN